MSTDVQWLIIRNTSSFLRKGKTATFTTEPLNLKNKNSFRYNGLIHKKAIGIEGTSDNKGVVLITKNKHINKPSRSLNKVQLKSSARRNLASIRKTIRNQRYRKDLKMAAVRRASAIIRSQKPVIVRKAAPKKAA